MSNKKIDKKIKAAKSKYPELNNINWSEIIRREPDVFNNIIGDIARSDTRRRSKLDRQTGTQKLNALTNTDHAEICFSEAFTIICGKESLRKTAEKLDISYSKVYNLKNGDTEPDIELMEKIAEVYNRKPSYFLEYRIAKVLISIEFFLTQNPETATVWFSKVKKDSGIVIR